MTLKELEIGDKFVNVKKPNEHWIVRGNPRFNALKGLPTRICVRCSNGALRNKSCKIEVEKIGESKHKEAMKKNPLKFINNDDYDNNF